MSTYTSSLGLEQITPGDQAGLWGNTTNNNLALIDQAVTGVTPISFAGLSGQTYTLTDFDGAVDEARSAVLNITGIAAGPNTVVIPNKQKMYLVRNNTGQNVVFQTPVPTASYTVGAGNSILIFCDGNNNVFTGIASPSVGTLSVSAGGTGSTTFTAGFVKSTGGTNALTSATTVDLASEVSGTLPVARGGTGAGTFTSGSLLVGNGTGNFGVLTGGGVGQVATWNGSQWTAATPASAGVTSVTAGTGISVSGSTGAVTIGNTGVTSLTAGAGISISGSTGGVTISATGSGGITSVAGSSTITANTVGSSVTISQTSGQAIAALGYTPYNSTNPSGYITGSSPTITTPTINGVTNGSSAGSGVVGQVITIATGSTVNLIDNTIVNLVSGTLPAGDWDIFGAWTVKTQSGASLNFVACGRSSSPSTLAGTTGGPYQMTANQNLTVAFLPEPVSISSPQTLNINMFSRFSGGVATGEVTVYARRAR